jgi:drug/metabolite transporter (DMT)-like permease
MPDRTQVITGVAYACLSTALGGMTVALTRLIIDQTDPLSLTFLRYGMGAIVLFILLAATQPMPRFSRRDIGFMTLLSLTMFTIFPFCMARAMADTTAAHGGLIFAMMPMLTFVMAGLFRVESFTWLKAIAVALTVFGAWIALGEQANPIAPNALVGDIYMFVGIAAASSFNVLAKRYLTRYGSVPVITFTMFTGSVALFVLALIFEQPLTGSLSFDLNGWLIVLMLGIPGAAIMVGAWGHALHLITPTHATITIGLNPLVAIVLGALLLNEPASVRVFGGFALILAAILIATYGPQRNGPQRNGGVPALP